MTLAQEECEREHHAAAARALDRIERIIEDMLWLLREGQVIGLTAPVNLNDAVGGRLDDGRKQG